MNARTPKRRLVPLVVEQWCTAVVLIALVLPVAAGVAGSRPGLAVIDALLLGALAATLAWGLRRRRLKEIVAAPLAPPEARFDSERRTIAFAVIAAPVAAVLLGALSVDAGPLIPISFAVLGLAFAWDAFMIQRWERRSDSRVYRERLIFARGAPFFYRTPQPSRSS